MIVMFRALLDIGDPQGVRFERAATDSHKLADDSTLLAGGVLTSTLGGAGREIDLPG
jgi:hypothetical protein